MTKAKAIYNFFNSFNMTAYPNVADSGATFPFITYESTIGNAGDNPVDIAVNVFYHTYSETAPNAKVEEISNKIGLGGLLLDYDNGTIWVQRGQPWCNSITNADSSIKQKQLNISLTFM